MIIYFAFLKKSKVSLITALESSSSILINTLKKLWKQILVKEIFPMSSKYITGVNKVECVLPEVATGGVLQKKAFLEISQILQESTCVGISF